jgi:hypothetical protein
VARLNGRAAKGRRQRALARRKGLCTRCLKEKTHDFSLCGRCRLGLKSSRLRKRHLGLCPNCSSRVDPGKVYCNTCIARCARHVVQKRRRWRLARLCLRCGKRRDGSSLQCKTCLLYMRQVKRRFWIRVRQALLDRLGHMCRCCGLRDGRFLSVDHVWNDGYKERRRTSNPYQLYRKILAGSVDSATVQLLCYNCNMAKAFNGGTCPHAALRSVPTPIEVDGTRSAAANRCPGLVRQKPA